MTSLDPPQQKVEALEGSVFSYFWSTWFRSIYSILGYQNCRTEEFTPDTTGFTIVGLTGMVANYTVFRNTLRFSIDITASTTVSAVAGATINVKDLNKFNITPKSNGYVVITDLLSNTHYGMGAINGGIAYMPSFNLQNVNISGFYLIEETK